MSLFGMFEKRATTYAQAWQSDSDPFLQGGRVKTKSGTKVGQDTALQMIAVYACQSLIADGVASLPIEAHRMDGDSAVPVKLPSWLKQPNPFEIPFAFWHKVLQSLLADGNAFIATMRNEQGRVVALFAIHPGMVTIEDDGAGSPLYRIDGSLYDRSQVLHIPAFSVPGFHRGLSPIDVAREAVGLGLTMEEYGSRFFSQGTTMAGVITHPGVPKPDEARLLREMFRKSHSGINNSHAVGVLTGGAQWTSITITPEHAQFLESRKFQNTQIAMLYRVPAYLLDPSVTSTWGSGIEEQNTNFTTMTLLPWITRIEQAISTYLLGGSTYMKFNVDSRMRAKTADRFNAHAVALNNGIKSIDEVRAEEDLPPLPNGLGTKFYRPLNMAEVGKEPPAPAPTTPAEPDDESSRGVPSVHIDPAQVHITMPNQRTKRIVRDPDTGEITSVVEE